ncbi:3-hydroxyacyl-CoA dehydrogenase family protein [Kitasatospora purpeofusca]|uniref:3-hydroxyacyl-CoA dehydrogenase family protein n=1 Tax=Kitasatospora purpeofusca TaxID=67352 RepID=UPI002258168C|nr:3-hydroxybutyryl-CoA dehydrogenase [Kitasatospora purpeofusca]MCX4757334.1 3-hydroxybutyryl-CoA dehydrogenase [Kitasatospora purpeofusca]WSR34924.1 3-hydroxybutyryl-CoA dehydrogenase [Kitasatospora purpeofusca]
MERPFPTVAVVGLGTMGTGVAVAVARSGRRVIGIEADENSAARALARIEESTAHAVDRERLTAEERAGLLARLTVGHSLASAAEADLVIEEVPEQLELKRQLFAELDRICPAGTVFATGTTALSVTRIAAATARPDRVLGLHFFNPVHTMKLVEVVRTVLTAPQVAEDAAALARDLGKEPVAAGDRAGFVVNGLLFAYLNQAAAMYESKYATREDIDAAMRLGCGLPMGPLALLDLIGVDTARTVLEAMYEQSRDRLHAPAPILGQLVSAGLLGRKTGRGFYTYEAPGSSRVVGTATGPARPGVTGREVRSVGVCGSGTMATGIVEVFAKAGYPVLLAARSLEKAERAKAQLAKSLERSVAKGRLTEEQRDAALGLVTPVGQYGELADVDLVVEAVAEDLGVKRELFTALDAIVKPGAVLATTTSSLPVVACASATGRPQDVVGMHFFNPAPAMRLVEVVSTVLTAPDVTATVLELCAKVRKHPVECGDRAGFIVNALLFPYLNDAVRMLQEHYATVDDIDTAMKLGCGYPMGPFELLDVVGLDVSLTIEQVLHQEFREPGLAAAPLLEHLVAAGCLGRKTGRGFRDHARR